MKKLESPFYFTY